jgi:hypothetical protein
MQHTSSRVVLGFVGLVVSLAVVGCDGGPELCKRILMPICGCDGATHSNACEANRAGSDVAAEGECGATTEDCRTTDCTGRATCQECRGVGGAVWVCIPAGAAC